MSLDFLRRQLAGVEALPPLILLAVAAGFLTGLVILLFRAALEGAAWLSGRSSAEHFESIGPWAWFLLPTAGAFLLGVVLNRLPPEGRRFGVVHVMERLSRHQGHMPLKSALYQFAGGVAGLGMGLSGGREGPAIHLGAATSSLLGNAFRLPNNSIRTLVACGTAAAIGASFNTPMAGVIFAMEVVMMEYTIASFIPVIIASVTATVVNRWVFGDVIAFAVPDTDLKSLLEIPYIAMAGVAVGAVGSAFILTVRKFASVQRGPFWVRATLAGAVTGVAAMLAPAVLGVGYDTVDLALLGDLAWTALLIILIAKFVASAACIGVGLPVGMVGPTLVMGAMLGGLLGVVGNALAPAYASEPSFYVMLGMAAMMAAVLQAPLAALLAVLELTANPAIILPAMLIIVVASLTVTHVGRQRSLPLATLSALGLQYPPDPASQHLMRAGAAGLMTRSVVRLARSSHVQDVREALARSPSWLAIDEDGDWRAVLFARDLATHLQALDEAAQQALAPSDGNSRQPALDARPGAEAIDLMEVPGLRKDAGVINNRATLLEALAEFRFTGVEALLRGHGRWRCRTGRRADPGRHRPLRGNAAPSIERASLGSNGTDGASVGLAYGSGSYNPLLPEDTRTRARAWIGRLPQTSTTAPCGASPAA